MKLVGRKLKITLASVIITSLVGYLGSKGIDIPPELQIELMALVVIIIGILVGTFNIGQGFADGMSNGKTSTSATSARRTKADMERATKEILDKLMPAVKKELDKDK